jgi:hypothetical protein
MTAATYVNGRVARILEVVADHHDPDAAFAEGTHNGDFAPLAA